MGIKKLKIKKKCQEEVEDQVVVVDHQVEVCSVEVAAQQEDKLLQLDHHLDKHLDRHLDRHHLDRHQLQQHLHQHLLHQQRNDGRRTRINYDWYGLRSWIRSCSSSSWKYDGRWKQWKRRKQWKRSTATATTGTNGTTTVPISTS